MPGFTHLQTAQPVTFGHHCMAYVEMFCRDLSRVRDAIARMDESPLGAAALAGTGFPIDRHARRRRWAFASRPAIRWTASPTAISRWSSFRRRDHARRICRGWPRKSSSGRRRNSASSAVGCLLDRLVDHAAEEEPDAAELVRAKTGRVNGHWSALLTVMKGLPLPIPRTCRKTRRPCSTPPRPST